MCFVGPICHGRSSQCSPKSSPRSPVPTTRTNGSNNGARRNTSLRRLRDGVWVLVEAWLTSCEVPRKRFMNSALDPRCLSRSWVQVEVYSVAWHGIDDQPTSMHQPLLCDAEDELQTEGPRAEPEQFMCPATPEFCSTTPVCGRHVLVATFA